MLKIVANNIELDLPDDLKVASTFEVFDMDDVKSYRGAYTKTIRLPKTPNNCKAFGFADDINTEATIINYRDGDITNSVHAPHAKIEAILIDDGSILFKSGYIVINSITESIDITLYSGVKDFADKLKDKKLGDLDLSDLYHVRNSTNFIASSHNTTIGSQPYVYPIIDWGDGLLATNVINNPEVGLDYLYPAVYVSYLFEKIISESGYTASDDLSAFLGSVYYDSVIPVVSRKSKNPDWATDRDLFVKHFEARLDADQYFGTSYWGVVSFNNIQYDPDGNTEYIGAYSAYGFIPDTTTELYLTLEATIINHHATEILYITLVGYDESSGNTFQVKQWYAEPGETKVISWNLDLDELAYLLPSYVVALVLNVDSAATINATVNKTGFKFKAHFAEITYFNHYFPFETNMPDMTQIEFLKSVALLCGVIMIPDEVEKVIRFTTYDMFYEYIELGYFEDWSDKLNLATQPKLQFKPDSYGRRTWFKYKELDITSETKGSDMTIYHSIGSHYLAIDIGYLDDEKTLIELDFYPTPTIVELSGNSVAWINSKNLQETAKNTILLMHPYEPHYQLEYINPGGSNFYSSGEQPFAYFYHPDYEDNLDFETILQARYSKLDKIIEKYTKVTAYFNLTASDISLLDFTKPIWVEHFQSFFYLSRVVDYISGKSTKVELIKLNF